MEDTDSERLKGKPPKAAGLLPRFCSGMRYYSVLISRGINIIANEGWGYFWRKLRNKIIRWQRRRTDRVRLYQHWIARSEPTSAVLESQRQKSFSFKYRPKISIITTDCDTDINLLVLAVGSVINQTYNNWELCLACSDANGPSAEQVLLKYAAKDDRIKVKFATGSKGLAEKRNEVLSLATGEFIGLMGQDDEIAPFALYDVVRTLNDNPNFDFIYSDEDQIDLNGKRSAPFFKPDWSPDMQLSFMYTGRFSIYRQSLVEALGGFRPEYNGSQDYDLALRVMAQTDRVCHIPRILYHRRAARSRLLTRRKMQGSLKDLKYRDDNKITQIGADLKLGSLADEAAARALTDYLASNNISGRVYEGNWKGSFRIQRDIIGNPLVSIIIPAKDNVELSKCCLESVWRLTEYPNYEVLVVDNRSTKTKDLVDYYREIKKQPRTRIIEYDQPYNFAALNNFAVSQANGEHLLLLNNDTEVISTGWLSAMLEHSQRREVGAVGAKLLYPNGTLQHCGVIIGLGEFSAHVYSRSPDKDGYFGRIGIINNYSAVTAACVMIRREVFEEMSGFDENLAVDFNDIDLCLRMREKGYLIVYTPYAQLYHLESYTRGYTRKRREQARYLRELQYVLSRWGDLREKGDPYYNPNLSLDSLDFSFGPVSRFKSD